MTGIPDAPFPTVTGPSWQPDLVRRGWEDYPRLAALKGAVDDLAADIVRHHVEAGAPVDHAVIHFESWLQREVGRSFAAASDALGVFDPRDPTASTELAELILAEHQAIGTVAVESRRRWAAAKLGGRTVAEALQNDRDGLALTLVRAFENQQLIASLDAGPGPDGDDNG